MGDDFINDVPISVKDDKGSESWTTIYIDDSGLKSARQTKTTKSYSYNGTELYFEIWDGNKKLGKSRNQLIVVDKTIPSALTIVEPNKNVLVLDDYEEEIFFSWKSNEEECQSPLVKYLIQISSDSNFENFEVNTTVSVNNYSKKLDAGSYYWRVAARDKVGNPNNWSDANWSEARKIVVQKPDILTINELDLDFNKLGNRTPLLLVHGWQNDAKPAKPSIGIWSNFISYYNQNNELRSKYKLYTVEYWSNLVSIAELGKQMRIRLDKVPTDVKDPNFVGKEVTILAHSMGGLVSRAFMNIEVDNIKGGERVDRLITLGTPHHGSPGSNGKSREALILKYNPLNISLLSIIDNKYYSLAMAVKPSDFNRFDMHWDNYDNLFDYQKYPNEDNTWLSGSEMNSDLTYDSKIIAFAGEFTNSDVSCKDFTAYKVGNTLINIIDLSKLIPLSNDGIVPIRSAWFEKHVVKAREFLPGYNHRRIASGYGLSDPLFASIKTYLLDETSKIMLVSPIETSFDACVVGNTIEKTIVLSNVGDKPVSISGLSLKNYESDQFEIISPVNLNFVVNKDVPQEIVIRFHPNSEGAKKTTLEIISDTDDNPVKTVELSGEASLSKTIIIAVSPNDIQFSEVNIGNSSMDIITLRNEGNSVLHISAININGDNSDQFKISEGLSPIQINPGQEEIVIVEFIPSGVGSFVANIQIQSNSDDNSVLNISLSGIGMPTEQKLLEIEPETEVNYEVVWLGVGNKQPISLTNISNLDISITNVTLSGDDLDQFEIVSPTSFIVSSPVMEKIFVKFSPTSEGQKTASLLITSDADNIPNHIISLTGFAKEKPTKILELIKTIDFGNVKTGTSIEKVINVKNDGNTSLIISKLTLLNNLNNQFKLKGENEIEIAPKSEGNVMILFTPLSEGIKTATLLLENNSDNESPTVSIEISGVGVANLAPNQPTLISPPNGEDNVSVTPTLIWSCTDPDGDLELTYSLWLDKGDGFNNLKSGIEESEYSIPEGTLDYETTYSWKVIANDGKLNSKQSEVWSFTTEKEDKIKPTVNISSSEANPTNSQSIRLQINFSEEVVGFDLSDLVLTNCTASNLQTVNNIEFTVDIVTGNDGELTVDINSDVLEDKAGNGNFAANQFSITYDGTRPTVELSTSKNEAVNSEKIVLTVRFSEEVVDFVGEMIGLSDGNVTNLQSNDNIIYTANLPSIEAGYMTVDLAEGKVNDLAGNSNIAADQLTIVYTGIEEFESQEYQIYPNPIKDYLNISSSDINQEVNIQIMTATGQVVFSEKWKSPFTHEIDFSNYSDGLYFIRLESDGNIVTRKVILVK